VLKRITLDNLKELVDETLDGDITDVAVPLIFRLQVLKTVRQLENAFELSHLKIAIVASYD